MPYWATWPSKALSCISCGKTSLSKSHHLISILKAEIQDELATGARLKPTDVPSELDKAGMRSFTAPVPSGTEQTGFYCSINWGIFHRHHNPPENHLKQLLLHESTLEKSVPSSGVSSKPSPAKAPDCMFPKMGQLKNDGQRNSRPALKEDRCHRAGWQQKLLRNYFSPCSGLQTSNPKCSLENRRPINHFLLPKVMDKPPSTADQILSSPNLHCPIQRDKSCLCWIKAGIWSSSVNLPIYSDYDFILPNFLRALLPKPTELNGYCK